MSALLLFTPLSLLLLMLLLACSEADRQINSAVKTDTKTNTKTTAKYCQSALEPFPYSVCQVDGEELLTNTNLNLKLFWRNGNDNTNKNNTPLYTYAALLKQLLPDQQLRFASNAGMYNQDFAPIGYTVINGKQILSLNLNKGGGNFHLLPNGVFWWNDTGFYITESNIMADLLESEVQPEFATQSGPMLVIDGKIHPKFKPDSNSTKIRNGVGVCEDGKIKLVHSDGFVNFYQFAKLFQSTLNCKNALFLDGGIASALYAPSLKRQDTKNMGVMIGLVEQIDDNPNATNGLPVKKAN